MFTESQSPIFKSMDTSGLDKVRQLIEKPSVVDPSRSSYPNIHQLRLDVGHDSSETNVLYLNYELTEENVEQEKSVKRLEDEKVENFIAAVSTKLNELIDKSAGKMKPLQESPYRSFNYTESLIHLHYCLKLHREAPLGGCESTFSKLQSMLIYGSRAEHQLTILKCPNGSSKSRMLAKLSNRAKELFGKDVILIPVFIGLTTRSCSIEDIFRSICVQINMILRQELDIETYSLQKLTNYFHGLTNRVSKSIKQVLIIIDSLENLQNSPKFENAQVDWLAAKLPPKFHIIVSSSSTETLPIIKRLESKLLNPEVIVYIGRMTKEECTNTLHNNLAKHKRKLVNDQYLRVIETLAEGHCPFMVEEISNIVIKWTSDTKLSDKSNNLPKNVDILLKQKLDTLEHRFSKTVIGAVCAYITLSRYGMTEIELLDCLSSNDSVLVAVYSQDSPHVLRFPCQVWVLIKQELGNSKVYIVPCCFLLI